MTSLFDDLKQGLSEALDIEQGKLKGNKTRYRIIPVRQYSNIEIRNVRIKSAMSQTAFANYLGVSNKTVEAWECGRTTPSGPALRLIELLDSGKIEDLDFIEKLE